MCAWQTDLNSAASSAGQPNGYGDWIQLNIYNDLSIPILVNEKALSWGKYYQCPDKDNELAPQNGIKINPGQYVSVCSCGRENASSGTTGSIEIYDGTTHVADVLWDCPHGSSNSMGLQKYSESYKVEFPPPSKEGAIGNVDVHVSRNSVSETR
jgi:hypothetical protein